MTAKDRRKKGGRKLKFLCIIFSDKSLIQKFYKSILISFLEMVKRGGDGMFATGIMSRTFNRMGNGYLGRADGGSASYRHGLFGK